TGGTNTSVTVSLSSGTLPAPVDLNWTGVTSFTVTTSAGAGSWFFFDDLSLLSSGTLSTDDYVIQKARVYPNPVDNILYIKNITGLKSIKVLNDIGQQVLESTESSIDVSRLFQGMYLLQIDTNLGVETKRIIKR
ncbi:MAG: T9SS type A sorting domain-containing protein, partial [Algibacter sp.]